MFFCYNLILFLGYPLILFFSLFNKKLRLNLAIRRGEDNLAFIPHLPRDKPIYWLHASSVGEFENAKAMALTLKAEKDCFILFSVYSSSAYLQRKDDPVPNVMFVLPFDFPLRTKRLVKEIKPDLILYSKYDVWPNMARYAKRLGIAQVLFSASLPKSSSRNSGFLKAFYRKVYRCLDMIYAISEPSRKRFENLHSNVVTMGDTRYEAIAHRAREVPTLVTDHIRKFRQNKKLLVGGSTYLTSEAFLAEAAAHDKDLQIILAPHHIDEPHLESLKVILRKYHLNYVFYSQLSSPKDIDAQVLVIDNMGILPYLYSFADYAYVGGGWQGSVHSVLEPAFFGKPILTGPAIDRFQEAIDLHEQELLMIMASESYAEVMAFIDLEKAEYQRISKGLKAFYQDCMGASGRILKDLQAKKLC